MIGVKDSLSKNECKSNLIKAKLYNLKGFAMTIATTTVNVIGYLYKKAQTENGKRILHWLLFSVFLSVLPLILSISQDKMSIECTFDQIKEKYATDFILAVFAVAVNLCGCTVYGRVRIDGLCISIVSMLYLLSKYTHLHNPKTELLPGVLNKLLIVVLTILLLNAIFGIIIQIASNKVSQ